MGGSIPPRYYQQRVTGEAETRGISRNLHQAGPGGFSEFPASDFYFRSE